MEKCTSCKQPFEQIGKGTICPRCVEWMEDAQKDPEPVVCTGCGGTMFREERRMILQKGQKPRMNWSWPALQSVFTYTCVGCGRVLREDQS